MSLLAKKLKNGNLCVLSCLVIRSKGPHIEQEPMPPANPRGEHVPEPRSPSKNLRYSEDPMTVKTAWEYYNEGTYPSTSPHIH
jgi:hypothetical protein